MSGASSSVLGRLLRHPSGFVGLLLAVPMAAGAGVLVRYGLSRYLRSRLYTGSPAPTPVLLPVEKAAARPARPLAKRKA